MWFTHCSTSGEELRLADSPGGERRKRNTLDSGYSTTDSCTARWSPVEVGTLVSHVTVIVDDVYALVVMNVY